MKSLKGVKRKNLRDNLVCMFFRTLQEWSLISPHSIFLIWIPSNDQWQDNYLIDLKNEVIFYDALSGE